MHALRIWPVCQQVLHCQIVLPLSNTLPRIPWPTPLFKYPLIQFYDHCRMIAGDRRQIKSKLTAYSMLPAAGVATTLREMLETGFKARWATARRILWQLCVSMHWKCLKFAGKLQSLRIMCRVEYTPMTCNPTSKGCSRVGLSFPRCSAETLHSCVVAVDSGRHPHLHETE